MKPNFNSGGSIKSAVDILIKTVLVFSLLLSANISSAQSIWTSFWNLSGPERCWVLTHPFIANKARKITKEAVAISEEMKNDTTLDGDAYGGQVDAFRHAYWMAVLSQKICTRKALSLGKAHEKGNYLNFRKGKSDEENQLPDSISSEMDSFNNRVGASLGSQKKNLEKDSLRLIIKTSIQTGQLRIISKNREGKYLDCAGSILDIALFFHTWNIPKCLVNSDQIMQIK